MTTEAGSLERRFWRGIEFGDRYGIVLVAIVTTYILLSTLDRTRWMRLLLAAALATTMLLVLYASRVHAVVVRVAVAGVTLALAFVLVQSITNSDLFSGSTSLIFGLLVLVSPFAILNRIFRHPEVSVATIVGAICAYLLIGIVFAELYLVLNDLDTFFAQGPRPPADFLYFSFVTLTTLGYGDLTAGSRAAKTVVVYEAVTGQLFLAILIARLVASFAGRRRKAD